MDLQLNGKTVLVTGATAGIGLEIARTLATEGARVVITGRDPAKLDSAIAAIKASGGLHISGVLADAASAEGAAIIAKAEPLIDILVNNLGIYESKAFGDITDADWSHLFDVNVMSGVRLSRTYLPGMLERNWGRIIFISSEFRPRHSAGYDPLRDEQDGAALDFARIGAADPRHQCHGQFRAAGSYPLGRHRGLPA